MSKTYTCPMHPEIVSDQPGRCPKCGMKLVLQDEVKNKTPEVDANVNSYLPLIVIIGLILAVTLTISYVDFLSGNFDITKTISYFMIGFFLTFAGFKLVDLEGFAQGYSTYDLLAQKVYSYGYIYPFIELFFGLAMIINHSSRLLLWAEVLVMLFSGVGVAIKLLKREKFQCVCLGTFLKVPLTYVTLIEDFGMALLAGILLVMI